MDTQQQFAQQLAPVDQAPAVVVPVLPPGAATAPAPVITTTPVPVTVIPVPAEAVPPTAPATVVPAPPAVVTAPVAVAPVAVAPAPVTASVEQPQPVQEYHAPGLLADPKTWIAVAFLIFVALFGRRLWTALTGVLDGRAAAISAELDEAARLRAEAEAMLRDARTQRETALADSKALLDGARAEAARVAEAARAEAQAAATRRERMAMDRIAAAEKAAVSDVRLAAADIAARAAERVIASNLSPETDAELIDRAIQGLPAALSGRRAA